MQGGAIFFAASMAAALFNYLYQVIATRQLSPKEFAELSVWVANLAPFLVGSAVLQYQANFQPASAKFLRIASIALTVLGVTFILGWGFEEPPFGLRHSILVVAATAMMAWLGGQTQIRLMFLLLGGGSLTLALGRVIFILVAGDNVSPLDKFALANLVAAVAAIAVFALGLFSAKGSPKSGDGDFWQKALVLSLAGALLPQFDMFLMGHTQMEADVIEFARAGLFGRAVYAISTIIAQWLLPNQIRRIKFGFKLSRVRVTVLLLGLCAAVGLLSPIISRYIFGWSSAPPQDLVFLASAELTLLAMLFVTIQAECAANHLKAAASILAILGIEAGLQFVFRFPMLTYLYLTLAVHMFILVSISKLRLKNLVPA